MFRLFSPNFKKTCIPIMVLCFVSFRSTGQSASQQTEELAELQQTISNLRFTELVMSMSQRSITIPSYITELKALIARQAYNFWSTSETEPYVSHLNVYSALHLANKAFGFDSVRRMAYNQIGGHSESVVSIQFGADPNYYYSASADGTIVKWSLLNPKALPETIFASAKIIRSIDITDDGKWILASLGNEGVVLVSLEHRLNGEMLSISDPEPVQTAVFIPDEQKYVSVTRSGEMKIKGFSTATRQIGKTTSRVLSLEVDPKDGTIYAGTLEGLLEAWDEQTYFGHDIGRPSINCLDISPDGKLLALGRERGDAVLWDIAEKKIIRIISGHQSAITDIDFSPDNAHLLTTSRDGTARLWDVNNSRKLPTIMDDHNSWVMTGCFDPSGTQIITGSMDEYIRTWPVAASVLAERLCFYLTRNMSELEWNEFVGYDIPYQKTCEELK